MVQIILIYKINKVLFFFFILDDSDHYYESLDSADKEKMFLYADANQLLTVNSKSLPTEDSTIPDYYDSFDSDIESGDDIKKVKFVIGN